MASHWSTMLRAEVKGFSIAYQRAGRGPVVVLLHGFLFDSRAWRPQLEGLSDDFTVIAWDAPGAGQSPDPPERFGITDWADCLAGLLDFAGVGSAHIVGLSWGGILAQEFYRRQPRRVRTLVLADTYAGWRGSLSAARSEERRRPAYGILCCQPPSSSRSTYLGCTACRRRGKSGKSWRASCPRSTRSVSG
jgi:pimeloyl-ACP methyl ester carboxylesterase